MYLYTYIVAGPHSLESSQNTGTPPRGPERAAFGTKRAKGVFDPLGEGFFKIPIRPEPEGGGWARDFLKKNPI